MAREDHDNREQPATWENIVVGKAKEAIGRAIGDGQLAAEGQMQEDVAHDVSEFDGEHFS